MMALIGKLAFVTGGGSGLGKATCQVLAREGALIVAADQNYKNVQETINSLPKNQNVQHLGLSLNVTELNNIKNALNNIIQKYSRPPSIIVNSAGIIRDNFLLKLSEADFDEVLNVNLKGTFLVVQTFADAIIKYDIKKSSIINIASIVGKYGNIGQSNYCASKAGVELLTKTAAKELGLHGIRVNAILPGMISTPMLESVPSKVRDKFERMIPLGRFGNPEEVAEVITFLATDKSSYMTGASIEVTGGF